MGLYFFRSFVEDAALEERNGYLSCSIHSMESSIIILNSFNGNFYFSNPARNNNPVRILVMQYKTLHTVRASPHIATARKAT